MDLAIAHGTGVSAATYAALAGALGLPFVPTNGVLAGRLRGSGIRAPDLAARRRH